MEGSTESLGEARDRYKFLAKLGSGGMADVYLGVQLGVEDFKRLVVIKRIRVADADGLRMLTDEARLVATLNHPHIVKMFDLSTLGEDLCITMEYVDGESLSYLQALAFADGEPVPLPIVCKWMIQACEALQYAHHARTPDGAPLRIIHRDIGPQNLIVDRNGYLKVIDFGIAKSAAQTELTSPGMFKGKLPYVAPDIFAHTELDGRIDLYALGLVFYEMVTLNAAFRFSSDVSVAEVMQRKMAGPLAAPSTVRKGIDPAFDALVLKATHPQREGRFVSGEEFAEAIRVAAGPVGGVASTREVGAWFHERFAERVAQRRQFERLAMAKASQQGQDTTTPSMAGDKRLDTVKTINFARIGSIEESVPTGLTDVSRRANPLVFAAVIFALLLGSVLAVRLLLWPADTKAPIAQGSVSMMFDNLLITSDPPGADVHIDGVHRGNTGSTGLHLRVDADREHTLTLSREGYKDYSVKFRGERFGQRRIRGTLDADGKSPQTGVSEKVGISKKIGATERKKPRRRRTPLVRRRPPPKKPRPAAPKPTPTVNAAALAEPDEVPTAEPSRAEPKRPVAHLQPPVKEAAAVLPLPPPPPPMLELAVPQRPNGPVRQSSNQIMSRRISGAAPEYPRSARERSIESTVEVRVVIDQDGNIRESRATSGERELRTAVRRALRDWRFEPYIVSGKPAETKGTLKFVFELQDSR